VAVLTFLCVLTILFWIRGYLVYDSVWLNLWKQNAVAAPPVVVAVRPSATQPWTLTRQFRNVRVDAVSLSSAHGKVSVAWHTFMAAAPPAQHWDWRRTNTLNIKAAWNPQSRHFLGFGYLYEYLSAQQYRATGPQAARAIVVPAWFLLAAFAVYPWVHVRGIGRRRRRREPGLCPRCGYDLRATPDRCPERGLSAAAGSDPKPTGGGPWAP
jgi:hypothetical protein